jgi:hypothetical protein
VVWWPDLEYATAHPNYPLDYTQLLVSYFTDGVCGFLLPVVITYLYILDNLDHNTIGEGHQESFCS